MYDPLDLQVGILHLFAEAQRAGRRRFDKGACGSQQVFTPRLTVNPPSPPSDVTVRASWGHRWVEGIERASVVAADPCSVCGAPREYREGRGQAVHLGRCGRAA
jgi:hypothetical protein